MITKEDFETWRANLVTEEVLRLVAKKAEECKEVWGSLLEAEPDPEFLAALPAEFLCMQAKAAGFRELANIQYEDLTEDEREEQGGDQGA